MANWIRLWRLSFIAASLVFYSPFASAQLFYDSTSLFSSHELIDMILVADFKTIFKEIKEKADTVYHDGTAYFKNKDSRPDTFRIEIKPRGNYRKDPSHCSFPPLFIKFIKKDAAGTPFEGLKKLKLVTHCSNTDKVFDQYVLREYLVYRVFNILNDTSLRVRPARITYIDTGGRLDTLERFAFFIENEDQMAERIGGKVIELKNIHQDRTSEFHTDLVEVFMYMVGNPDWSISVQHNVIIVQTNPFLMPYVIPYDFDYCGVVNTSYAAPADELDIATVIERVFLGFCRSKKEFEQSFDLFRTKKEEIYQLYKDMNYLDEKSLNWSLRYYDKFYETINDPESVKREFLKKCWPERNLN